MSLLFLLDLCCFTTDRCTDVTLFHAGTILDDSVLKTAGGRVIASTAIADSLEQAIAKAYQGVKCINFKGMQYRTDIGARALKLM